LKVGKWDDLNQWLVLFSTGSGRCAEIRHDA